MDTEAVHAADNTATSGSAQDQPLMDVQSAVAPETGTEGQAQEAAPAAEQTKPEDEPLLTPEGAEPEKDTGAPESYEDFALPEGFVLEGEVKEEAVGLFKGLDLSQKGAQKLVDYYVKRVTEGKAQELEALAARRKGWRSEIRQRPGFSEERALALKGMRAVVTDPDEKALFEDSWMCDHPALWKLFTKVGRLVSEDTGMPSGSKETESSLNIRRFTEKPN